MKKKRETDAQRIKRLRAATGLTQAKAGELLGLDLRSYQRLESGETRRVKKPYFEALERAPRKKA